MPINLFHNSHLTFIELRKTDFQISSKKWCANFPEIIEFQMVVSYPQILYTL